MATESSPRDARSTDGGAGETRTVSDTEFLYAVFEDARWDGEDEYTVTLTTADMARLRTAAARLSEREADAARLDWLDRCPHPLHLSYTRSGTLVTEASFHPRDIRAAIDAALSSTRPPHLED